MHSYAKQGCYCGFKDHIFDNYKEIIPIQEEVLISAEEDLKLAQQKYELGSASILELLDAQLALIQASSTLVRTKYDAAIQVAMNQTPQQPQLVGGSGTSSSGSVASKLMSTLNPLGRILK